MTRQGHRTADPHTEARSRPSLRAIAAAMCLAASPALAQEFEVMGTVDASIDGTEASLWIPYGPEDDEAYAFLAGPKVMTTLSIDAFSGTPGAEFAAPRLAMSVMRPGPQAIAVDLQLFRAGESGRMYLADDAQGAFDIAGMTVDGRVIGFDFTATAVATDLATFAPIPGRDPVTISGRVEVTLRDE